MTSHTAFWHTVLLLVAGAAAEVPILGRSYWERTSREEIQASLKYKLNTGVAKNVIIFIGDGMGANTITAARIYKGGASSFLSWERFPHLGALKTYAEDKLVTDSGASGTSMFTGVKTNYNVLGLDGTVKLNDCNAAQNESAQLTHLTTLFQAVGKSTGIVTTARITHATPAGLYAHSANRDWECQVPDNAVQCKDIARQMVEDLPARDINVLLGGGRATLLPNITQFDDPEEKPCGRKDGRNLIRYWEEDKENRGATYKVVYNTKSLLDVNTTSTDYLLGLFAPSHMKYDYERDQSDSGTPSLQDMTITALNILSKNEKGFFLMVEAEHVDLAHHSGWARKSLHEVGKLSDTVEATLKLLQEKGVMEETLVIVTSDHSHTLTIGGYPLRGSNILGIAQLSDVDNTPYTSLSYANGRNGYHYIVNGTNVSREDPSKVNTSDWNYGHQVAIPMARNTHGGHDVLIYASGPFAHLFKHMHEQNYVAEVVKYAARLGEYTNVGSASSISLPIKGILIAPISLSIVFYNGRNP